MPRILIRHQTGSKARQTDMLDFGASSEVLIGRDPSCALAFDENLDATVSRKHARIVRSPVDPDLFTIENLSGNGTFVDGHRIAAPTPLSHGSSVRFGLAGPSFVFELDPPPVQGAPKPTVFDFGGDNAKTPRVVIKHKTGSKAPHTESLDFSRFNEALIGRNGSCAIAYDDSVDQTVSHEHAKIVQDSADPVRFTIEDLSRRNGTFVDGHRINAPTLLHHGSEVRLGRSGPSFAFELDPPPSKPTVADVGQEALRKEGAKAGGWWDGQTLFDSLVAPNQVRSPARIALLVATALLLAVVGVGVYLFATKPTGPKGILDSAGSAVVSIDATWRLFDPESGRQAYHWYVPNPSSSTPARLPVFVRMGDGVIEPVLILDDERDTNRPVGGRVLGSGCVVQDNGFILTSGLLAAPFNGPYKWPEGTAPAVLIDPEGHSISVTNELPGGWVPLSSRFVITRRTSVEDLRLGQVEPTGRRLDGRLDAIFIGFSGTQNRISAKLVGMSANNKLALVKADVLKPVHSVSVRSAKEALGGADRAYLLGYPLGSRADRKAAVRLATVVKTAEGALGQEMAACPGCFQISESGADAGFEGGPVFDDQGRLAGVFVPLIGERRSFLAIVPIDQAADLLGLSRK